MKWLVVIIALGTAVVAGAPIQPDASTVTAGGCLALLMTREVSSVWRARLGRASDKRFMDFLGRIDITMSKLNDGIIRLMERSEK